MTTLQLEYSKLRESQRHNQATELTEAFKAQESRRHNYVTEALSAQDLAEKIRHQQQQDAETLRHNKATEAEIVRHNKATEAQAKADNELKLRLNELNNALTREIEFAKLSNAKEIAQMNNDVKERMAAADRALNRYKAVTSNLLDLTSLKQTGTRIANESQKLQEELKQIQANTKKAEQEALAKTAEAMTKYPAGYAAAVATEGLDSQGREKLIKETTSTKNIWKNIQKMVPSLTLGFEAGEYAGKTLKESLKKLGSESFQVEK